MLSHDDAIEEKVMSFLPGFLILFFLLLLLGSGFALSDDELLEGLAILEVFDTTVGMYVCMYVQCGYGYDDCPCEEECWVEAVVLVDALPGDSEPDARG